MNAISETKLDFPIINIISTGTSSSGNALAGMGAPNDGLLTVETQKQVPSTFTDVNNIELALSHNELLFSMEVMEIIKDMFFDETK